MQVVGWQNAHLVPAAVEWIEGLTPCKRDLMRLRLDGATDAEIAVTLGRNRRAVQKSRQRIEHALCEALDIVERESAPSRYADAADMYRVLGAQRSASNAVLRDAGLLDPKEPMRCYGACKRLLTRADFHYNGSRKRAAGNWCVECDRAYRRSKQVGQPGPSPWETFLYWFPLNGGVVFGITTARDYTYHLRMSCYADAYGAAFDPSTVRRRQFPLRSIALSFEKRLTSVTEAAGAFASMGGYSAQRESVANCSLAEFDWLLDLAYDAEDLNFVTSET
jgi:hypothetical protein